MSDKYIIKNCDAIHKHPVGHWNCVNDIECQKREDCKLKQIVNRCMKEIEQYRNKNYDATMNPLHFGMQAFAFEILQILDIEVIDPKIKRSECPYGGIDCAWCGEECE